MNGNFLFVFADSDTLLRGLTYHLAVHVLYLQVGCSIHLYRGQFPTAVIPARVPRSTLIALHLLPLYEALDFVNL